jgi:uncharacterized delta-60 repeat protein
MRRTVMSSLLAFVTLSLALPAWAVSLDLDPSFSTDGVIGWSLQDGDGEALARDGGHVLTAGSYSGPSASRIFVARVNDDGSPDDSFGGDGVVTAGARGIRSEVALEVLQDHSVLVAYNRKDGIVIRKWTPEGVLDPTFAGDGERTVMAAATGIVSQAQLDVDTEGRIVVATMVKVKDGYNALIARLMPNGPFDDTLSGDGRRTINLGVTDWVDALATDASDRIVLGTDYYDMSVKNFPDYGALVRLRQNGSFDTTFSGNGIVRFRMLAQEGVNFPLEIEIDDQGKLTVAAVAGSAAYGAIRLLPDGTFDSAYGHDGVLSVNCACALFAASVNGGRVAIAGNKGFVGGTTDSYDSTTIVVRISASGARIDRRSLDLFPGSFQEGVRAVLIDGPRTLIGGQSLKRAFLARFG